MFPGQPCQFKSVGAGHRDVSQEQCHVGLEEDAESVLDGTCLDEVLSELCKHDLVGQELGRCVID